MDGSQARCHRIGVDLLPVVGGKGNQDADAGDQQRERPWQGSARDASLSSNTSFPRRRESIRHDTVGAFDGPGNPSARMHRSG